MTSHEIDLILKSQREFFRNGNTLSPVFRIEMLCRLKKAVKANEKRIIEALRKDLGKSEFESYMCEVGMVLSELSYMIDNTEKFMKRQKVKTPVAQFKAKSYRLPSPYGNTLIMSPWNYPFLLTLDPLIDAIAAGNTAIVKPSAYSPATSEVVKEIIEDTFDPCFVAVVTGGRAENACLLEKKFDLIFFTGSQNVGKEVLRKAAEHLTPSILELGGKSPCIVDNTANIGLAAKRIVFGKFLNCGQTCVAPDYIFCQASVRNVLVEAICDEIKKQFGKNPLANENYGKIINEKHFERLIALIDKEKVVAGGEYDASSLRIAPTVMDNVSWDDAVMADEIFGPILPIVTFDSFDDVIPTLIDKPKPLALYFFSDDPLRTKVVTEMLSFGGGCINDTIIHLATSEMGFGGVGESGMGAYHGKEGFDAFTHYKSIVDKKTWIDLSMRYQPYKEGNKKLLRIFLK